VVKQRRPLVEASSSSERRISRRLVGQFLLGAGALVVAACGAPPASPPAGATTAADTKPAATTAAGAATPAAAPAKAGKVKVQFANDWNTLIRLDTVKLFEQKVEEQYPNIDLERLQIGAEAGTAGDFRNIVITGIAANTAPEIIWGWVGILVDFPDKMADLTDAMKSLNFNIKDTLHVPENVMVGDKLYALPANPQLGGWYYNKTMFDKAGVKVPDDTWTWDSVADAARKLTNPGANEYGIFASNGEWGGWWDWVGSGGGFPFNKDGKTGFADADGPEAFERWINFIHKDKVSPSPAQAQAMTSATVTSVFASGKIGLTPGLFQEAGREIDRIGNRFEWSMMLCPRNPKNQARAYWVASEDFVIPAQTKQRGSFEAAAQASKVWFDDPVQGLIAERLPTLPAMVKWFKADSFLKPPPLNREMINKGLEDFNKHPLYSNGYRKGWGQWRTAYRAELDKAFAGETPPRDALKMAVEAGDKAIANVR
jgi:ABC-type glycerol-3-phosphate transport system substrate-binding protein